MRRELEFASHPGNLSAMRDFVREFLSTGLLSESEVDLIVLGIDEACTNIIRHAYDLDPGHLIILSCERRDHSLVFRIRDFGKPLEPSHLQSRSLESTRPGGLGLYLIRRAFDSVDYRPQEKGTELVLVKRIPSL